MNTPYIINAVFLGFIPLSGFIPRPSAAPYPVFPFALHILAALGMVIYLIFQAVNYAKLNAIPDGFGVWPLLTIVCVILLFTSGTFMSLNKFTSRMAILHGFTSIAAIISIGMVVNFLITK